MLRQQINNFIPQTSFLALFAQQVMAVSFAFRFMKSSTKLSLIAGAVLASLQGNHLV